MGELRPIGENIILYTPKQYAERKSMYLRSIDPKCEYVVLDKIFCRHCGREKSLDMPERNFYIKCACPCVEQREKEQLKAEERAAKAREYQKINELTLPAEVRGASFYKTVTSTSSERYLNICERCEKFCHNFEAVKQSGRGIWLYGEFDTGKTYLAVSILKQLQMEGVLCTFTTMERILEELKATYSSTAITTEQSVMALYATVECLIIDNFSGVKSTRKGAENWVADKFCEIIQRRVDQHLPTVITSRSSIKDLATDGLLPRAIVDKLVNKMVPMLLVENQRRATQQALEF